MGKWLDLALKLPGGNMGETIGTIETIAPPIVPNVTNVPGIDCDLEPEKAESENYRNTNSDLPSEWAEALTRLQAMPCPANVPPEAWECLLLDAARFLETWGSQASALGWTIEDLLAVHPGAPLARLGSAGACWIIRGREIAAATETAIVIRNERGVTQTITKPDLHESVMPWELP